MSGEGVAVPAFLICLIPESKHHYPDMLLIGIYERISTMHDAVQKFDSKNALISMRNGSMLNNYVMKHDQNDCS